MTVLHTGATKKYTTGWEHIFGKPTSGKGAKGAAKKIASKKGAKKKRKKT